MRILVTGGAGFIGSHLCDALVAEGHTVRVLDSLDAQVHQTLRGQPPTYLHPSVEFCWGDVRSPVQVIRALQDVEVIVHFAAAVGVGQSMYRIADYTSVNNLGTAVLLEEIARNSVVKKLIVASSMSVYGEAWMLSGLGPIGIPRPSREEHPVDLRSVYALSKYDQERMCLIFGEAYGIPTTALRFFNVYGTRQSLFNPYTGVIAIFASRLLNNKPPLIYEDGAQSRDFISVHDVVSACMRALHSDATGVFNVGTGWRSTVRGVAELLADVLEKDIQPVFTGTKRAGDIRHCIADTSNALRVLGFRATTDIRDGLEELVPWLREQHAVDKVDDAARELEERGLVR